MRIALALGSGGARGWAHIGVLQVLQERGHEVVALAGTSAGALVGGLFAAGKLPEFTDWVVTLTQRDVLMLLDPVIGGAGMIRAQRMLDHVALLLDDARIEDLPIPFTAVATDLEAQREIWFEHGSIASAIRASIAIPSLITPVVLHGRLLADGGLMNPVPMDPLSGAPTDLTVAVDLNANVGRGHGGQPIAESADPAPGPAWLDRLRRTAVLKPLLEGPPALPDLTAPPRDLRATDVLNLALNASQSLVTRFRTAANPPDVWVSVPVDAAGTLEFHRANELIRLGRLLCEDALDAEGI